MKPRKQFIPEGISFFTLEKQKVAREHIDFEIRVKFRFTRIFGEIFTVIKNFSRLKFGKIFTRFSRVTQYLRNCSLVDKKFRV